MHSNPRFYSTLYRSLIKKENLPRRSIRKSNISLRNNKILLEIVKQVEMRGIFRLLRIQIKCYFLRMIILWERVRRKGRINKMDLEWLGIPQSDKEEITSTIKLHQETLDKIAFTLVIMSRKSSQIKLTQCPAVANPLIKWPSLTEFRS